MSTEMQIADKVALVTGSNRGLGTALVEQLMERGASKVYCAAREIDSLGPIKARYGARAVVLALDVTNPAQVEAARNQAADLDLLISNAGVTYMVPMRETTLQGVRTTMETNFFGPLQLVYAFAPLLEERRGGFLYILSLAALISAKDAEFYSASKAAGSMLGQAVRSAYPGIAVSMSYPGLMDTDMMASTPLVKTSPQEIAKRSLDGWGCGEPIIFPDRHALLAQKALLTRGSDVLSDPNGVMRDMIVEYMRATGSSVPAS